MSHCASMADMSFWHQIAQPIIGLSPMDGVTDPAFRFIVARHGKPDVQFTEFINVDEIGYGVESAWHQLRYAEIERPVVAQIYGADPDKFYQMVQVICALGFDGVDINMGCPSKSVSARGCGAALIKTPPLAREIIRAAQAGVKDWVSGRDPATLGLRPKVLEKVQSLSIPSNARRSIPVSVKTRLGYDAVVIEDWVTILLEEQPEVISIHGRTLAQMYRGRADWAAIGRAAKLVRETSTLVLGNGDVESMSDLIDRVRETHVHGVLIGRGGLGNPWLFLQKQWAKAQLRETASPSSIPEILLDERFRVAVEHARYFESLGGGSRFSSMRKHLGWYCKGFPGAAETRSRMFRTTSSVDVERVLNETGYPQA
jgi:nifR3 family TIM-barrel protein